jgi:hypothetical protein
VGISEAARLLVSPPRAFGRTTRRQKNAAAVKGHGGDGRWHRTIPWPKRPSSSAPRASKANGEDWTLESVSMMSSHLVTRCCCCWHAFSEYIIIEESGAGIAEEQRFVGGKKDGVGVGLYASKKKASAASKREACNYWRKWRRPELVVWDPCQWPMVNGQWSAQYPCDYDLGTDGAQWPMVSSTTQHQHEGT